MSLKYMIRLFSVPLCLIFNVQLSMLSMSMLLQGLFTNKFKLYGWPSNDPLTGVWRQNHLLTYLFLILDKVLFLYDYRERYFAVKAKAKPRQEKQTGHLKLFHCLGIEPKSLGYFCSCWEGEQVLGAGFRRRSQVCYEDWALPFALSLCTIRFWCMVLGVQVDFQIGWYMNLQSCFIEERKSLLYQYGINCTYQANIWVLFTSPFLKIPILEK